MASKLYRCHSRACQAKAAGRGRGHEFRAEAKPGELPACPACGLDPRAHPRFASVIVPLAVIHFDPPTEVLGVGTNARACDGQPVQMPTDERGNAAGNHFGTGDPTAVTCPACKETDPYLTALAAALGE